MDKDGTKRRAMIEGGKLGEEFCRSRGLCMVGK